MKTFVLMLVSVGAASAAFAIDIPGLRYVDRYTLPYTAGLNGTVYGSTLFGGISGMDYDASSGSYYAISDDRSQNAPAGGTTRHGSTTFRSMWARAALWAPTR